MKIEIRDAPFDAWVELQSYQRRLSPGSFGATAMFIGSMRDFNEGDNISKMTLEHYSGMTEQHLISFTKKILVENDVEDILLLHRVGEIVPGESIVLVAVWSAHRADAFEACEKLVEELKSQAPFWKKEHLTDGQSRWVEHNTAGPWTNLN